jgi:uncharacterized membrane protein
MERHRLRRKNILMKRFRLDLEGTFRLVLFVLMFVIFLLIYGLSARQSFAAGTILAIFYEILCKIHFRLRR